MSEIYKQLSEDIFLKNYVNGVLHDASGPVTVEIFQDGDSIATPSTTHISTGIYSANIASSHTQEETELTAIWSYNSTTKTDKYDVVTPYLDVQTIISLAPDGTPWEDAKYAEAYARNKITRATAQTFGNELKTILVLGRGTDYLPLPHRIIDFTQMYENNNLVIDSNIDLNIFNQFGVVVSSTNFALVLDPVGRDFAEFRQTGIKFMGRAFKESYSYSIFGRFGWESVPEAIASATRELIEDYWCQDNKWREAYVLNIKTTSGWQVEFQPGVFVSTGNSYVDYILADYTWLGVVII